MGNNFIQNLRLLISCKQKNLLAQEGFDLFIPGSVIISLSDLYSDIQRFKREGCVAPVKNIHISLRICSP